ncbi:MAG: metallophosphoesterase [Candidatus Methanoperedens sp.]|nr:metallophosphoesterase [Candidatus Methanoperedens sp.]
MSTIRILHLSDLQFGKKNRYNNPTPDSNIGTFAKSIADEVKIPPDMIVVTGDIAHSASKKEYQDALEFFKKLDAEFKKCGKQPTLYIVPGNHDLECNKTGLNDAEKNFDAKFFQYNFFIQSLHGSQEFCTKFNHSYYVSKACNDQILIIGLNSAINITKDDMRGEISFKQIDGAIQEIEKKNTTFRIAIVHHNFTRNSDNDQTNIRDADIIQHKLIDAKIQLLLHGHQHIASAELRRNLVNGNQIFILSAGSTSLRPARTDFEVQNQFQLITLELEPTIKVSVDRKVFSVQQNKHGKWTPDGSEAKNGKFHFFIYPENIRSVIEAIQEIKDCQICSKTPSIHFSKGFESPELYKILLENTTRRLWIFGRKNWKLFDSSVRNELTKFLNRQKAEKLDFKVLFLNPNAPDTIISKAHADSKNFIIRLNESIEHARTACKKNDIIFEDICRFYQKERCIATIIIDNAVLFKKINIDKDEKPEPLTDTPFDIVSSDSVIGIDLVRHFKETWSDKSVKPSKYSINVLKATNELGIEDIFLRKVSEIEAGRERYKDQIYRAISNQFDKNSGKIQIYCVAAQDIFDIDYPENVIARMIVKNLNRSENKCTLEVLILCPKSNAYEIRDGLEKGHGLRTHIELSLDRLRNLNIEKPEKIKFKLYDLIPSVLLIITDDFVFVETYPMYKIEGKVVSIGGKLPMLMIKKMTHEGIENKMYQIWKDHFDYAWNNFSHDDGKPCTLEYKEFRDKIS